MRPAEIWLMTVEPTAPRVGLELHDRRVLGARPARAAPWPLTDWKAACASLREALGQRGHRARAQARDAVAGDELGQVAPVRADVGEGARRAAELLVDAPVVVLRTQQPVLQVAAVDQPQRAGRAGAHALARLAHGRVVAVDERDGRDPARARRPRRSAPGRRRRRARSASRRSRACRRPAPPRRAGRADGWACRCGRRRRPAPRRAPPRESNARSAPSAAAARRALSRRGRRDPDEACACKPGGARMNGTDEPGPSNGNTNTSRHVNQRSSAFIRVSSKSSAVIRPLLGATLWC